MTMRRYKCRVLWFGSGDRSFYDPGLFWTWALLLNLQIAAYYRKSKVGE